MNMSKASKSYGILYQTFKDQWTGVVKVGKKTLTNKNEQETLVEQVTGMSQLGYGYTHVQLKHFAGELAFSLGRKQNSKPLSNNWLYGFLAR